MTRNQVCFGLMPALDAACDLPRTVLPLKSVRYEFAVRAGLAEVTMTQVYRQENSQPLDCEYLFPLPADGAVFRCEAVVNGRLISARIEEREAARKLVEQKKAEGRRTALVESERENLFTLSLGNVQPRDLVEVTLAYLQPLRRHHRQVSLDLPLCPGVRYIPGRALLRTNRGQGMVDDTDQVPDASRITPPRIDAEHPDAAFVEVDGQIDATFLDGDVDSPSHALSLERRGEVLRLALAKGGEVPDRDLSLRWLEREPAQPALRGWISQSNGDHFALLELRAPASIEAAHAAPQDVYFLVDRSGSMQGEKWQKAIDALHGCVAVLGPRDRVWVTLFESTFRDFDAKPTSPATLLADRRFRELAAVGTAGGTEMGPALSHVLAKVRTLSPNRPAVMVLITDAEIGNEQEVVELMRDHPELPVHCFGIDTTLNDSLLLDLVRQQGGTFHALNPKEDVAARVTQLGRTLSQPVLVSLRAPEGWELAAGAMPNLYAGQVHMVSLRCQRPLASNKLAATAVDHRNQPVTLDFQLTTVSEASPRLRWCKQRLVSLAAKNDQAGAVALSRESNLLCPFTAFVAWDDQEKVAVADHRLVQPSLTPQGVVDFQRACCLESFAQPSAALARRVRASLAARRPGVTAACLVATLPSTTPQLTQRIHQLVKAVGELPRSAELAAALQRVLEHLARAADPDTANAVTELLENWERLVAEWHRQLALLLHQASIPADPVTPASRMLHDLSRDPAGRPAFYGEVRSALIIATSANPLPSLQGPLAAMERMEDSLLQHVERFFGHQPSSKPLSPNTPPVA